MEQRRIGNTDLVCSAIGFGTWEMANENYGSVDVNEAIQAINTAIDHGITLFDTAEVYGPFTSEELLAKALGPRRKEVTIVTKVSHEYENNKAGPPNSKPDHVIQRTEGCLRRLQTDTIDLLLIHHFDSKTPFEETIGGLEQLKREGKIRHYGVSNLNVRLMETWLKHGTMATNQVCYHAFDRRVERELLPYCAKNNIGFMSYGSMGFGLLSGAFTMETTFEENDWRGKHDAFGLPLFEREAFAKELRVVERLKALAAGYDKTVAQLAIAWVLRNPAVSTALVGIRNERELKENIVAAEWKLSDEDQIAIDRIFAEERVPTYSDAEVLIWGGETQRVRSDGKPFEIMKI